MRKRVVIAMMAAVLLLIGSSVVNAVEPIPCTFYGVIHIDGGHVRTGSIVTPLIDGVPYSLPVGVMFYGGEYWYQVQVRGYDADSPGTEGWARPGDTISFMIDGMRASETGVWSVGGKVNLDLNAHPRHLFMPLVRHGPDPAIVGDAP